jgi:hypothetical protein
LIEHMQGRAASGLRRLARSPTMKQGHRVGHLDAAQRSVALYDSPLPEFTMMPAGLRQQGRGLSNGILRNAQERAGGAPRSCRISVRDGNPTVP